VSGTAVWTLYWHSLPRRQSFVGCVSEEVAETLAAKGVVTWEIDWQCRIVEADRAYGFFISAYPLVLLV
jgi:hypothetical protein